MSQLRSATVTAQASLQALFRSQKWPVSLSALAWARALIMPAAWLVGAIADAEAFGPFLTDAAAHLCWTCLEAKGSSISIGPDARAETEAPGQIGHSGSGWESQAARQS